MPDRGGEPASAAPYSSDEMARAVDLAVVATGAPAGVRVDARVVLRLDGSGGAYVLVALGAAAGDGDEGWLAAVTPSPPDVLVWATTAQPTWPPHPGGTSEGHLVWWPSAASRSPLYPLLRLDGSSGPVFIDSSGSRVDGTSGGKGG